jgi:hypothetical protein
MWPAFLIAEKRQILSKVEGVNPILIFFKV